MIKYNCLVSFAILPTNYTFPWYRFYMYGFMHRGVIYINKTCHGFYFTECAPKPKGRFVIFVIYKLRKMPNMYLIEYYGLCRP